jgi:hypothetical protein
VDVRLLSTRPGLLQWPPVEAKYFKVTESDPKAPVIGHLNGNGCEGLPGVYSTIWCLCYKTNKVKKGREKEGNRPS